MTDDGKHLVFVYGTLKKGYRNHRLLANQMFIGHATTINKYKLYDLGAFPGMVEVKNGDKVRGELWMVDSHTMRALDYLEGVPLLYQRKLVQLASHPDIEVETYIFQGNVSECVCCGEEWGV